MSSSTEVWGKLSSSQELESRETLERRFQQLQERLDEFTEEIRQRLDTEQPAATDPAPRSKFIVVVGKRILEFLSHVWKLASEQSRHACQEIWNRPELRTLILVMGVLLLILVGIRYLSSYADQVERVWLDSDIDYFATKQETRALSSVSANGRWIVFASDVDNLVDGDTNETFDIFLHDRKTHATTRISLSNEGQQADGWSQDPSISPDGRYVVFASAAHNLVKKKTEGVAHLFIRDIISNTTFLLDDVLAHEQNTETSLQGEIVTATVSSSVADAIDMSFVAASAFLPQQWWMPITRWEQLRLYDQHERARGLAKRHLSVVMYYYQQYFTSLTLTTMSALIAAICLAVISRTGWSNTSRYLIALFALMTASSIFFGAMPNFFEYSKNIEANKKAFIAAAILENQILSYVSTGKVLSVDSTSDNQAIGATARIPPAEFIVRVDSQLADLFALPIEMNPEMIPSASEILTQLNPDGSQ